ncbi:MAG: hypothetical protein PVI43_00255 [Candidatus Bathyarchaeota archaeon]|jgi:hypothetical protein
MGDGLPGDGELDQAQGRAASELTCLLPCPFCGAPAAPAVNETPTKRPTWRIGCINYCVSMRRGTKRDVIADWNTRAR